MQNEGQQAYDEAHKRAEDAMEKIHKSNNLFEIMQIDREELGPAIKARLAAKLALERRRAGNKAVGSEE